MFGGKGGVGKTTCAAAAALAASRAAPRKRVLLLSTDPAHSLGDALGQALGDEARRVRGGPPNLFARELDAARAFGEIRARLAGAVDRLFEGGPEAGPRGGVAIADHDRRVMRDLLELSPPGVDELVAVMEVTDQLAGETRGDYDLVVMDTAPTGHALRLVEMPALAHEWLKTLMSIVLKYQAVAGIGELGSTLLRLSRGVGHLRALLGDPASTRFVAVTRTALLPRAETIRLFECLETAGVSTPILIVNAAGAGTCRRCRAERKVQHAEIRALDAGLKRAGARPTMLVAPAEIPPPHGAARLASWWRKLSTPGLQLPTSKRAG
jgi:arsenite-transporting ATPase